MATPILVRVNGQHTTLGRAYAGYPEDQRAVSYQTARSRVQGGWSVHEAITTPREKGGRPRKQAAQ